MSQTLENRKRCLACEKYGTNVCPLMADADVFVIDKCILEDSRVKNLKENTSEWFMFVHNPLLFLSYLNFERKDILPDIGSKVVTLRSGFRGFGGNTRFIKDIDDEYITLVDSMGKVCGISQIKNWYGDFFEI